MVAGGLLLAISCLGRGRGWWEAEMGQIGCLLDADKEGWGPLFPGSVFGQLLSAIAASPEYSRSEGESR